MKGLRKLIRTLILEANLDLSEWDPPGEEEDPYWERGYDAYEDRYISHGWRRKDNKKDATEEQFDRVYSSF